VLFFAYMENLRADYGKDEAFRLIVELRKNVFPKMTDEELVSFRKDMAYYLDTKNL